jgi:hypothetical protein
MNAEKGGGLTEFEIDMLWVFYRPEESMDRCRRINLPENFEKRKAAVHKLLDLGLVEDVGFFNLRITHAGHTFLDGG